MVIPQNDIFYEQPSVLKGHFFCVTRVAAHSRFYCSPFSKSDAQSIQSVSLSVIKPHVFSKTANHSCGWTVHQTAIYMYYIATCSLGHLVRQPTSLILSSIIRIYHRKCERICYCLKVPNINLFMKTNIFT